MLIVENVVKEVLGMSRLIPFNKNNLIRTGFGVFDNMLDDFFADSWPLTRSLAGDTFKIDVKENENEYIVEAEVAGVKKEEISLNLADERLQIAISKDEQKEESEKTYIHRERRCCSMTRNIFLEGADTAGIKAKLEDGVLSVTVPKRKNLDSTIKIDIE